MRGAVMLLALAAVAQPAAGCTISAPYRPLTARPVGTQQVWLVDVVALNLRRYPAMAQVRVVGNGTVHSIAYWRAMSGGRRDPAKGERLKVFMKGGNALGWASRAEAKAF